MRQYTKKQMILQTSHFPHSEYFLRQAFSTKQQILVIYKLNPVWKHQILTQDESVAGDITFSVSKDLMIRNGKFIKSKRVKDLNL